MEKKTSELIRIVVFILCALISCVFLTRVASSPKLHAHEIESLEQNRTNITRLTAAATTASVAVTLLPGDTATPVADNLADLTDYFLIALCAVYLEKYLITMTGFATFGVLFPLAFIFLAIRVKRKDPRLNHYIVKLFAFGIALVMVMPGSVAVSDAIYNTYHFSIEEAVAKSKKLGEEIEAETEKDKSQEDGSLLNRVVDSAENVVSDIMDKTKEFVSTGESILNDLLEKLAIILVTSCVIPIAVLVFYLWLIQLFTNVDIPMPYPRGRIGMTRKILKGTNKRYCSSQIQDKHR